MRRALSTLAEIAEALTGPLRCLVRRRHDPVWTGDGYLCRTCLLPVRP